MYYHEVLVQIQRWAWNGCSRKLTLAHDKVINQPLNLQKFQSLYTTEIPIGPQVCRHTNSLWEFFVYSQTVSSREFSFTMSTAGQRRWSSSVPRWMDMTQKLQLELIHHQVCLKTHNITSEGHGLGFQKVRPGLQPKLPLSNHTHKCVSGEKVTCCVYSKHTAHHPVNGN